MREDSILYAFIEEKFVTDTADSGFDEVIPSPSCHVYSFLHCLLVTNVRVTNLPGLPETKFVFLDVEFSVQNPSAVLIVNQLITQKKGL